MQPVGTKPNNSTDKILSYSLDLLRFPMITIIVLIHTNFAVQPAYMENLAANNCDAGIANGIMYYIIGFLAWVSTPVFYTMSGYLFFYKTGDFDKTVYIKKISRRIHSLLIPYIIWNLSYLIILLTAQLIVPDLINSNKHTDMSGMKWLWAFWDMSRINPVNVPGPIDGPLYFIKEIMVMSIFSPLFYFVLKNRKTGICALAISMCLFWFNEELHLKDTYANSVAFFGTGAYLSIHGINIASVSKKYLKLSFPLVVICCIAGFLSFDSKFENLANNIYSTLACMSAFGVAELYAGHKIQGNPEYTPCRILPSSVFFIFASHSMVLSLLMKILLRIWPLNSDIEVLVCFAVIWILGTAIPLSAYILCRKVFPRFTAVICGGR